jgi:hypothetical protein
MKLGMIVQLYELPKSIKTPKLLKSARQLPRFARQIQNISGVYSMLFIILIRSKYFIKVNPIMILMGRKAK